MTKEEKKAKGREYYQKHRAEIAARYRADRDRIQEQRRQYRAAHPELISSANRAQYQKNRVERLEEQKLYHAAHLEEDNQRAREWHEKNKEEDRERHRRWRARNRGLAASYRASYRALETMAQPAWADRREIAALYAEANRQTILTGIPHEVDHVWPLNGKGFVGLHVPWNLRVVPKSENCRKRNRRPTADEVTGG